MTRDEEEVSTLYGIDIGSVIGGRYRLDRELRTVSGAVSYAATDQTLARSAMLLLAYQHAADVVDAARRSALLTDPRIPRVLDVGSVPAGSLGTGPDGALAPEIAYVVTETIEGRTLAERLRTGPQRPQRARAIVGEAAQALTAASGRGLHHLSLTPADVAVGDEGQVWVSGIAVLAAASGRDARSAEDADRADAAALVRILYAALTAHWPGDAGLDGIPPAPARADGVPPASALVPGLPPDLAELGSAALRPAGEGPRTPDEIAETLAPWSFDDPGREPFAAPAEGPSAVDDVLGLFAPTASAGAIEAGLPTRRATRFPVRLTGTAPATQEPDEDLSLPADETAVLDVSRDDAPGPEPVPAWTPEPRPAFVAAATAAGPDEPEEPPRRGHGALWALGALGLLIVAGLVTAVIALTHVDAPAPAAAPAAPATSAHSAAPTTATPSPSAPESAPPPTVDSVTAIDPEGDGSENPQSAPLVLDGDPATFWRSQTYSSATFGNLKSGVGLVLALRQDAEVHAVHLVTHGTGGDVQVRTATSPAGDGATTIGQSALTDGETTIRIDPPATARYVVLWFDSLPQVSGSYRIEVASVGLE